MLSLRWAAALLWLGVSLSATFVSGAENVGIPTVENRPKLQRSEGKRWERVHQIVRNEIHAAAKKFLTDRHQSLTLPLEVELLFLGFDSDGGYGYTLQSAEFEELMATTLGQSELCPTVWETGEQSAVCFNVNYYTLPVDYQPLAIRHIEEEMLRNMNFVMNSTVDFPGQRDHKVQVYDVEASGHLEDMLSTVLLTAMSEAGRPDSGQDLDPSHHPAIIILNPDKFRMSPVEGARRPVDHELNANTFTNEWRQGKVTVPMLLEQEAGFIYRYKYEGRGASAAWLSRYNFLVIDLAAGPVSFGPTVSPSGAVSPVAVPRLMPLLARMATEIQSTGEGTLKTHMAEEAALGEHRILVGQLVNVIASATRFVLCPDLSTSQLRKSARILVPIVVICDHAEFNPLAMDEAGSRGIDIGQVQIALDSLLDHEQHGVVSSSQTWLHHHRTVASALAKSRISRSDAVMGREDGLHVIQHVHIDSALLLQELRMSDDLLLLSLISDDFYEHPDFSDLDEPLVGALRHSGTRVLPIFVLSLKQAPDQLLLDNRQLVAHSPHGVVVLQLIGQSEEADNPPHGRIDTGHLLDGKKLTMDAAGNPTRHVIAGMAAALSGVVPPYERYDVLEDAHVQDWRWAVGATPWGPYSNFSGTSELMIVAARRNELISSVEVVVRRINSRMEQIDAFVAKHLMHPFQHLRQERSEAKELSVMHLWLNELAKQSFAYNESLPPAVTARLKEALKDLEKRIEMLSVHMFNQAWAEAEKELSDLTTVVDSFSRIVGHDLTIAAQVVECCALKHRGPINGPPAALAATVIMLWAIAAVGALAVRSTRPPKGRGGILGSLPSWTAPSR